MGLAIIRCAMILSVSCSLYAGEKITIAFGGAIAPWVIPDKDAGIVVDIFESTMAPLGYQIEKMYVPYSRRARVFRQGLVDVTSDMNPNTIEQEGLEGFFSDTAYTYENFAFSLKSRNYHFTSISQLSSVKLLSWQGAAVHLGGEYAAMAKNNPNYSETSDQSLQVKGLFRGRVDVVQMDRLIFEYFRAVEGNSGEIDATLEVDRFSLFGKSPNGFLFRSKKMRDDFNEQLKLLIASGQYDLIIKKYTSNEVPD